LFVTDDGCLQIGDLAFCRFLNGGSELTAQPGTAHYQAPEVYEEGSYTEKVDVFAFGLILYEILALEPVFHPSLPVQVVMKKLVTERFEHFPDDWQPTARRLLNLCLQSCPCSRPTFAEIELHLKDSNFQIVAGVTSHAVQAFLKTVQKRINDDEPED
jgi:serine/threonine protein kinase